MKIGALGAFASCLSINAWAVDPTEETVIDHALFHRLLAGNDKEVTWILNQKSNGLIGKTVGARKISTAFSVIMASYSTQGSEYFHDEVALNQMRGMIRELLELQYPNGTIDAGGNRQSPPDTAFLLEYLCPAAALLRRNRSQESDQVAKSLDEFLLKAGEALLTGGVHTPNHRWVISAALARLYTLYPDERYLNRIDEWLADGVYMDDDGQFSERSRIYSRVEDSSLIAIGYLLNRPELLDIVRKNLVSTYYFLEDNGELITLDSRRQDQNLQFSVSPFYIYYRYLAILQRDEMLAAITHKIESFKDFDQQVLSKSLIHFLDTPLLLRELPKQAELPDNYVEYFPLTQLARIKRGPITATLMGGNDQPVNIASGRSCNPTFFTYRKGNAILEYVRLSTSFFNTGYVRSEELVKDQNTYHLYERKEAYYYQPMPAEKRNPHGDYQLSKSLDGRYWSKMDFENRPVSNVQQMETNITIREDNGEFELIIQVSASGGVEVTLELCFRSGGQFSDVLAANNGADFFLKDGYGTYRMDEDEIRVGPGLYEHENIERIDGELYTTHFGSIKGKGMHLYLTGHTPFSHTMTLK